MRTLDDLTPSGRTPLTSAVSEAADVLDYRKSPGVIVVVTDGEETCGASPCDLGKKLRAFAEQLTVHIIGFRMKDFSWTGENSILDAKCLAEESLYQRRKQGRPGRGAQVDAGMPHDLRESRAKIAAQCPLMAADSTDRRNTLCELLRW